MSLLSFRSGDRVGEWGSRTATRQAVSATRSIFGEVAHPGLIPECANPECRSGWFQLFRRRSTPVFEGGWNCSPECTEARMRSAVQREREGPGLTRGAHHHRIPLGLVMLEQGWINPWQLRKALDAQRASGSGRLGEWLMRHGAVDEATVARALSLQWSCPVVSGEIGSLEMPPWSVPRLFLDAFGVVPLRIAAGNILYLGFEQNLDPVLALAVERMTGIRVETGIVRLSTFRSCRERLSHNDFPSIQLAEAVSESAAARLLARAVERVQPVASQLVRVHDCLWLRMLVSRQQQWAPDIDAIQDVICSIGPL